jgi:3',5'-cyclic AMP phosphodiesterase CpdA
MNPWLQRGSLLAALATLTLLPACFQDNRLPLQPAARQSQAQLSAMRSTPREPAFGNTATNLRRILAQPQTGRFRFAFFGDNRNSSPFTTGANKIYAKLIDQVNRDQPNFAINGGDFTFDSLNTHWRDFEKVNSAIRVPFLTVVGNHDILFGRSYYENNYTPPNPETGLDDYSFDFNNTRLIVIDNAQYNLTERQFQWLERQLQTPMKKIVMAHSPPRHGVWDHKLSPSKENSARWMGLHEKYRVDLVLLSHIHIYDSRTVNGVPYVVSGGGGAPLDKNKSWGQSLYHYVMVEVDASGVRHQLVPVQTKIQTLGPTGFSTGLEANQLNSPQILQQYPQDIIPPEEK